MELDKQIAWLEEHLYEALDALTAQGGDQYPYWRSIQDRIPEVLAS